MKGGVLIRDATLADLEDLADFNAALAWESEHKRLDRQVLAAGLARALNAPALCRYFVAEEGGRVLGQTMLTFELTDWRDGLVYWIQSVYVRPEARQRGIYRRLYEHVRSVARADPAARGLRLYVEQDNQGAIGCYERLGMQRAPFYFYDADL